MTYARSLAILVVLGVVAVAACGGDDVPQLSTQELMDPAACQDCHPQHYREWSGSMHAYATEDPVFLAMNRRGQAATKGALGDFCVKCHAPMAVHLGLTTDGLNLDQVPAYAKGVTCFFCHSVDAVEGTHNNPLRLASDGVMRGGIRNVAPGAAHKSAYSPLVDADSQESSPLCGACHDIVTQGGVHLERTFAEWKTTIFARAEPRQHLSCGQCHMFTTPDIVADVPGVPLRDRREHTFAGIDVALTPFPEMDAQREAIARDLRATLLPKLCVTPVAGGQIEYTLDNVGAGHAWPSGASHDRRAWAEVIAYDAENAVVYDSGALGDDQDPEDVLADDPDLWRLYDDGFDAQGAHAGFFWEIARVDASRLLPPQVTTDPSDPAFYHAITRVYPVAGRLQDIVRVTARVRIRPLPLRLVDTLIAENDLDPAVKAAIPTFEVEGATLTWTAETASNGCVVP
jgi:hypothetical protein